MKWQTQIFLLMKKVLSLTVIVASVTVALAQQKMDSTIATELNAITVKAIRASDDAPFTKADITKQDLQRVNTGVDLPILLNQQTNAVTTSDAGTGIGYAGIRLRGSDISHTNVTMNGVPVNDAEGQGTYFVNFADVASSTQNIQIQRGVGSSTNGAAAFGASINLNTLDQPIKHYVQFNTDVAQFNTFKNTFKASTGLMKNKFCVSMRISKISSDGYIARSAAKLLSGQLTIGYYANKNTSIVFNYMPGTEVTGQAWNGVPQDSLAKNRTYNELGKKPDGTFYDEQTDNYTQHYLQLLINHRVNEHWKIAVTPYTTLGYGYYNEYKQAQQLSNYLLPPFIKDSALVEYSDLIRQLWLSNALIGLNANATATYSKALYSFGLASNAYLGQHFGIVKQVIDYAFPEKKFYELGATKFDNSAFAKAEWSANKLIKYFIDCQYRFVDYNIEGFRNNPTLAKHKQYNFFNPKIGVQYSITNKEHTTQKLYASFALAHKEPNRGDLETGITQEPKYEVLRNVEIGYIAKNKTNTLQANVYYMGYQNQLVATGRINDVGEYSRQNVDRSFRAGIELEMTNILRHNRLILNSNIAFSTNKIANSVEYIDDYDAGGQQIINHKNPDISFSPSLVAGVTVGVLPFAKNKLRIDLMNKFVGKQYLDNTSNEARAIQSYITTDAIINHVLKIRKLQLGLRAGVLNAWNSLYLSNGYTYSYISGAQIKASNYYFPQARRRFSIGASIVL
jgi:iron complex outermembrane recepter protein